MGTVFALDKNSHSNVSTQPGRIARRYLDQRLRLSLLRAVDAVEDSPQSPEGFDGAGDHPAGVDQKPTRTRRHSADPPLPPSLARCASHRRRSRVVQTARRILAEVRRLDDALDQLSSPGGTLALGALPVTAAGVLPGALIRLKATYPAIKLRLQEGRTEELLPLLVSGEIDLIIGRLYAPAVPDQFSREPLWTEPISILARAEHPILSETVTVDVLRRYDLILPTGTSAGRTGDRASARAAWSPCSDLFALSSYGFIREMLHATDLISVMPRLMMVGDLLRGTLKVVPLPIPAPDRPAGVILPRDRPLSNAGRSFVQCLRAFVAEIAERGVAGIASRYSDAERSNTTHPDDQG